MRIYDREIEIITHSLQYFACTHRKIRRNHRQLCWADSREIYIHHRISSRSTQQITIFFGAVIEYILQFIIEYFVLLHPKYARFSENALIRDYRQKPETKSQCFLLVNRVLCFYWDLVPFVQREDSNRDFSCLWIFLKRHECLQSRDKTQIIHVFVNNSVGRAISETTLLRLGFLPWSLPVDRIINTSSEWHKHTPAQPINYVIFALYWPNGTSKLQK